MVSAAFACAGQAEAGLTQISELEGELSQLQSLNAKLEEDLLAAERSGSRLSKAGKAGNGHDPGDASQSGFGELLSGQGKLPDQQTTLDL